MGNVVYPLSLIYSAVLTGSQGMSETLIPEDGSFLPGALALLLLPTSLQWIPVPQVSNS